ncbi:MAG: RNA polymerase sigma factor [Elusimicrobia bacterium]|nr:RNA polymerase sigma factor [Elusimicrobiota bacterium]
MAFEAVQGRNFEEFVRSYGNKAYQFAYRLCGNPEEAKEMAQEAFHRLLAHLDEHDPSKPFDAWFFRILRNVVFDETRRHERRRTVSLDVPVSGPFGEESYADLLPDQEEALLETLERRDAGAAVRRALDKLSPEHRSVLVLCDMEGRGYEEAAKVLDVPLGTIRSRINRARMAFRTVLSRMPEVKP